MAVPESLVESVLRDDGFTPHVFTSYDLVFLKNGRKEKVYQTGGHGLRKEAYFVLLGRKTRIHKGSTSYA